MTSAPAPNSKVAIEVDLGADGEPKGRSRLVFAPHRDRTTFVLLNLRVPLGMVIEETDEGLIEITGALPGTEYSAYDEVQPGDLVRAVTAYRDVVGDAAMWQQVFSYTPVGKTTRKRLIFRTEGARYADVRDAIASHRSDEGVLLGEVTLIIERQLDVNATWAPPDEPASAGLEPLQEVLRRDFQRGRAESAGKELDRLSAADRAKRLFGVEGADDEDS